jgi:hypothetical protein
MAGADLSSEYASQIVGIEGMDQRFHSGLSEHAARMRRMQEDMARRAGRDDAACGQLLGTLDAMLKEAEAEE